ncbi:MAG: outer membrane lipoprotein-sorting protein [Calditrichaceae bacterium]
MKIQLLIILLILAPVLIFSQDSGESAKEIVRKANDLLRANSSIAQVTMEIVKPDWSRKYSMKIWSLEPEYGLVLITSPAKDKGLVTLKREQEVWNWIPAVQRMIKIPPSMMLQSWMGSDFTNDDLVRQSSVVDDYEHRILEEEKLNEYTCYKLELIPKPEAGVVWGKILLWVSKDSYLELKSEYYDEDGILIKYMTGSNVRKMGDRIIPSRWEMIPVDKPGQKTVFEYEDMKFNVKIDRAFFSEQNMKRVR